MDRITQNPGPKYHPARCRRRSICTRTSTEQSPRDAARRRAQDHLAWQRQGVVNGASWSALASLTPSQRAKVVGHVAELPDDLGVAEIARSRITSATERYRADVAFF